MRQVDFSHELQLLLTATRPTLTSTQTEDLRALTSKPTDWDRFLMLATCHGVRPLVYQSLKTLDADLVPDPVLETLHLALRANTAHSLLLGSELERITNLLEENGIPIIPYKGVTLGEQLYGNAALRESGDIDVIVPPEQVMKAVALLQNTGYQPLFKLSSKQEETYIRGIHHYNLSHMSKAFSLEVHWDIISPHHRLPIPWPEIWHQQNIEAPTPCDSFRMFDVQTLLLLLLIHGSKHRWEALKWLVDVVHLIDRNPDIEWNVLMEEAEEWQAKRMALLGLYIAEKLYNTSLPPVIGQQIDENSTVVSLADEVFSVIEEPVTTSDLSHVGYQMRTRDRWQERVRFAWRITTHPNFQDIEGEGCSLATVYKRRLKRIVGKRGVYPIVELISQMMSSINTSSAGDDRS